MCKVTDRFFNEVNLLRQETRDGYILFVDDDKGTQAMFKRIAGQYGYETKGASNVSEARNLIVNDVKNIRCAVIDLHLGNESGEDVIRFIEGEAGELPYVVYTGDAVAGSDISKKHRRAIVIYKTEEIDNLLQALGII